MSAGQVAVLVVATVIAAAGGAAAMAAEFTGPRLRGKHRRVLHVLGVIAPYAGLAVLLWVVWRTT